MAYTRATLQFALLLVFLCHVLPLFPFTSLSLFCIQSFPPTHTLCVYKPHAPLALPPLRTITTVPISAASKSNSSPRLDSLFLRGYYISASMWCLIFLGPHISVISNISAVATSNLLSGYRAFLSFSRECTFNYVTELSLRSLSSLSSAYPR